MNIDSRALPVVASIVLTILRSSAVFPLPDRDALATVHIGSKETCK